jgi:hypothetical protein
MLTSIAIFYAGVFIGWFTCAICAMSRDNERK